MENKDKNIVFVNPPSPFLIDQLVMPPLGIMYLSSYLRSKGLDTKIHDLAQRKDSIPYAKYTAFTATTPQYNYAVDAMKSIEHDTVKIIGGPHVSCFDCNNDFDVTVKGEGELALTSICNTSKIENCRIVGSPIWDLDKLPFPDREWDGFKNYRYIFKDHNFTTAITSRGCPYRCGFCFNMFGTKVRFMSAEKVIEEANIIKDLGYDGIMYYDDTFTLNKNRAKKIYNGLHDIDIKFRCFVRANTVNYDLLKHMKDNGCIEIGMGVESGSQKILNNINKGITVEQCKKVISDCHKIGLSIKIFLMIGLPSENKHTIEETKKLITESKPDDFDITIYTPFPNTNIYDTYQKDRHNKSRKIDIVFKENIDYNSMFYKGVNGRYSSNVETQGLSFEDIEKIRDDIESLKDIIK